eukprot:2695353-Prymnesium_polylepis.1
MDVYERPAARALSGSMYGTQGAHPGCGGRWGAGLSEYGGNMCENAGLCTDNSQHAGQHSRAFRRSGTPHLELTEPISS